MGDPIEDSESTASAPESDAVVPPPSSLSILQWCMQGFRAACCLKVNIGHLAPSPWQLFCLMALSLAALTALARLEVPGPAVFELFGWLYPFAATAFLLFFVWACLAHGRQTDDHPSPLPAWFGLFTVAALPIDMLGIALAALAARDLLPLWWSNGAWGAWAIFIVLWVWLLVSVFRITAALTNSRARQILVVFIVLAVQGFAMWQMNYRPWQADYSAEEAQHSAAAESLTLSQEVFETQQALLSTSINALQPRAPDRINVYGIVYAPYSQSVFVRESTMVKNVLQDRFGAAGRVVQLVNHPSMTTSTPWATHKNLAEVVQAIANKMNPQEDVLVIYLTSHGGSDFKLASSHWPLEVQDLTPDMLRTMLDEAGIRNRVIAVSACYSGGWIEPLAADNSLVMTAADATHTSYGCGRKSELTYFGRAVFDEQLRTTHSFEKAFKAAVPIIQQREIEGKKADGFSNPQISVGKDIHPLLVKLETELSQRQAGK